MSEILDNIYGRSVALYLELYFLVFLEVVEVYFWWKNFQSLIFMFSFYTKNSRTGSRKTCITQGLFVIESCPTPRWVTFLIFSRLIYDISSHSNDLILARSTSLQDSHRKWKVSHQNSELVYEIFQILNRQ